MKKREIFMLSSAVFSLGIIVGFLFSPIKNGIVIIGGSSTSNNYVQKHSAMDENDDTNL